MDAMKLRPGRNAPHELNVIVEVPAGSQNKYEYDKKNKIIKLDRVLFSPFHYPGDYGFIPRTKAEDNDPLDALVLVTFPTYPGVLIEARPIGILHMIDSGSKDDKILCVPVYDTRFAMIKDIRDVQPHVLAEIAHFFEVYKHLEKKKVSVQGWEGVNKAKSVVLRAVKRFKR
ncbi:MAG TPA: inorganic diphosphatase [Candidatus Nanoarchaeia archaeon]|nr:inorganic diphosphatase [Candidatus Nanoarchaeia archaeon]